MMVRLIKELCNHKIVASMAEGRRLVSQGAIIVNDKKASSDQEVNSGDIVKIGKKKCQIV